MTSRALPRFAFPLALVAILLVALWARAWRLTAWPMWLDEAYSAFAAEQGLRFIWTILPTYETHPPFYSSMLSLWSSLAGTSLFGFRSLGLAAALVTLPIVWAAARELARNVGQDARWLGLMALALFAVAPAIVDMSRLVRPYYLMILVNAAGCWALLRLARGLREQDRLIPAAWVAYLGCLVLLVWLHSLGSLYAAGLGLGLIVAAGPKALLAHWKRYFAGHLLAAAAVAPALYILADQAGQWTEATWLGFYPANVPRNLQLIYGVDGLMGTAIALALVAAAILTMPQGRKRLGAALLVMSAFPITMAIILSIAVAPVFLVRTLIAASVPVLLLFAAGAGSKLITRALFAILLLMALIRTAQVQQLEPEQQWDRAVEWLAPRLAPGDMVYAYPNESALPFRFALRYHGVAASIRDVPSGIPARDPAGWYPTGSRGVQSLQPWRLAQIADDSVSQRTPTIWLLRLSKQFYDRDEAFLKILKARRDEVARLELGPIEIVGLRRRARALRREPR